MPLTTVAKVFHSMLYMERGKSVRLVCIACQNGGKYLSVLRYRLLHSRRIGKRTLSVRLDISVKLGEYFAQKTVARSLVDYSVEGGIKLLQMLGVVFL